jgi:hypothetical protein
MVSGRGACTNFHGAESEQWRCGRAWLERGDQDCESASTQRVRCKGARVMWQGERTEWQSRVVGQRVHKNSRGEMECEWRTYVKRREGEK